MYARAALKAMLGETVVGTIPVELMTTNRIMERWSEACGNGLPTDAWDDQRRSRPPPLDDDSAYVIDTLVLSLPPRTKKLVNCWYRRPLPTVEIAKELGMSRRSLEKALHVSLNFIKWKIERTKHPTLLKLLRIGV